MAVCRRQRQGASNQMIGRWPRARRNSVRPFDNSAVRSGPWGLRVSAGECAIPNGRAPGPAIGRGRSRPKAGGGPDNAFVGARQSGPAFFPLRQGFYALGIAGEIPSSKFEQLQQSTNSEDGKSQRRPRAQSDGRAFDQPKAERNRPPA